MRICTKCERELDDDKFRKNRSKCRECYNEQCRLWRKNNPERCRQYAKGEKRKQYEYTYNRSDKHRLAALAGRQKLKAAIIDHYSNGTMSCKHCGFNDARALSIDHIHGNGNAHRKEVGEGYNMYGWLIKNDFPDGFQVLCMNCQFIKRHENNELYPSRVV